MTRSLETANVALSKSNLFHRKLPDQTLRRMAIKAPGITENQRIASNHTGIPWASDTDPL
jgi:hypothetical protein